MAQSDEVNTGSARKTEEWENFGNPKRRKNGRIEELENF